jgi:peptide/nickel transport system permease protein
VRRQLAARLIQSLIVVIIVTTISFVMIRMAPGDPFSYDDPRLTPAMQAHWREQFGWDRPIPEQYVRYVTSLARGQLGHSYTKNTSVANALAQAIPRTLLLTGLALSLSFVLGGIVGVLQATRRRGWFDRVTSGVLLLFYSLPDFWGALMILLIFAWWWPVLPAGGIVDAATHDSLGLWASIADRLAHLILPVTALTLLTMSGIARHQRSAILEVLPADFIRTARAKGLSEREVIWRHALRMALTPMIALFGLVLPAFIGGALFVERVFAWPGVGMLAADAINGRDYDLVSAIVMLGAVAVAFGNLVADLLHMAIDPRVRE